jgi:hypothetical protein
VWSTIRLRLMADHDLIIEPAVQLAERDHDVFAIADAVEHVGQLRRTDRHDPTSPTSHMTFWRFNELQRPQTLSMAKSLLWR